MRSPALLPLVLTWIASPAATQSAADRLTAEQVAEDLRALDTAVREHWSYLEARRAAKDVDLDQLLAAARKRGTSGTTLGEMATALHELVAGLHDGHAGLWIPGVVPPPRRRLPLQAVACAEGVIVTQVVDPPGASRPASGPRRGDLLRSVGGVPLDAALAHARRSAFGSTPGMRERIALESLLWTEGRAVALELEGPDGARRTATLDTLPAEPPELRALAAGATPSLSWPEPEVALLRIPSFAVADWQGWLAAPPENRDAFLVESKQRLDRLLATVHERKARALILDLRGNGGGTDLLGIHLAQRLLARPFVYFRLSARHAGSWLAPAGITYQPQAPVFTGPLVVLIDAGSFSTTSNLVRCLDDLHPDLTVIGRPDGAGTGAPSKIVTLPHSRAEVTLCTHRVSGPKSGHIEGVGTEPDLLVTWTRADVLAGKDPDLLAALRRLAR
jgi:C-terminal processing protease CtpA/Prc